MDFMIRPCRLDDAHEIRSLSRTELGYDYPPEAVRGKLKLMMEKQSDRIFVADLDGCVVGYIHAADYDVLYAPHLKNILGIAVSSKYRRMGIGKALLTAVEVWALETGAEGVRLVSGETRTDTHDFYRHCGYESNKKQLNFKKPIIF